MKRFFALMLLASPLNLMCSIGDGSHLNGLESFKEVSIHASIEDDGVEYGGSAQCHYSNDGTLLKQYDTPSSFMTDSGYRATVLIKELILANRPYANVDFSVDYVPLADIPFASYLQNVPVVSYFVTPIKVFNGNTSMADNEKRGFSFRIESIDGYRDATLELAAFIETKDTSDFKDLTLREPDDE